MFNRKGHEGKGAQSIICLSGLRLILYPYNEDLEWQANRKQSRIGQRHALTILTPFSILHTRSYLMVLSRHYEAMRRTFLFPAVQSS